MKDKVGIFSRWNLIIPVFIILCLCHSSVLGAGTLNEVSTTPTKGSPILAEPPIPANKCPNPSTIFPCTCTYSIFLEQVIIVCDGRTATQTAIETAFREIRKVNGIPEGSGVHIGAFQLKGTELTQVDLAPFYGSGMDLLEIENNVNLTRFVTSGYEEDQGSIHATFLTFNLISMGQDGFGDALKYFSKDMYRFFLYGLKNRDVDAEADKQDNKSGEFLPGLSSLTNLNALDILNCDIIGELNRDRWNFTGFQRIQHLNLEQSHINGIGEGVFDFDLDEEYIDHLYIYLSFNQLNEDSFHPNSGIAKTGRPTLLYLRDNQFTTLPAPIFETFLDAYHQNFLDLTNNPLICEERLGWIKSRRVEFHNRVDGADCSNDKGHTVFDSSLIPIPPRLPPIFVPLCPSSSAILPCSCSNSSTGLSISCSGSEVNQDVITTAFREIREVNGIPGGRGIHIYEFLLNETKLTNLDLAPFYGSRLDSLTVAFSANLMTLVTSGYEYDQGSIQVNLLQIVNSPLGDFGFRDLLNYFTNDRKTTVDLSNNQLTTLPAPIFETFLDAQPQNFLRLTGNPLICDKRLSWIKARAFEFVYWVENGNCVNDPGHTVFNSALIP